jgi:beta-glucosidase
LGFEETRVPGAPQTSFGWSVVPEAFTELLTSLRDRYPDLPPIYITENGCAYPDEIHDDRRITYLRTHLDAVAAAVAQGVDIRGYFCWSLMDNFEWAEGYGQRFGLVNVDYVTQDRTPRDSYRWYQQLIAR